MNEAAFKQRTKQVALRIIKLSQALPKDRESDVMARQLIRAGTSVGANYRAVCRAKSKADMVNKLVIVEEEADEAMFWLELLVESGLMNESRTQDLYRELNEILSMVVVSQQTIRQNLKNKQT